MKFFSLLLLFTVSLFAHHSESSYPYLSGYTWWHFCDWRLTNPDFGKATPSSFNPENVGAGDTIFVERNCLDAFVRDFLPKLRHPIILVTGNYGYGADKPLPGPYAYLLENEKVAAWFVQNIDRAPSEKLIPIPIGLASNYWPHGDISLVDALIPEALKNETRSHFIYLNFSMTPEREVCSNYFNLMGVRVEPRKSYREYLHDLSHALFVISPPGGGIDCHRTWEALLMGCYPVVLSNTLNPLYEDLPVVIVQNWMDVTESFLEEEYERLKSQTWTREKLYFSYWAKKVHDLQKKIRN